jgi:hypothetical protein
MPRTVKSRAGTTACRSRLVAVALIASAILAGCADNELDEGQIESAERVLQAWADAWERHDGAAVCATLTEAMKARYGAGDRGCAWRARAQS